MPTVRIYEDTTSPSLTDTITVNGTAFDLTSSTVKFRMRAVGSTTLKVDAAATVVSAVAGTVRYDWVAADTDTPGDYVGWWRVTLPSTRVQETTEFPVEVIAHAAASSLTTLAEVRQYLQIPALDVDQDPEIDELITAATAAIERYCSREFVVSGTNPQTRVFDVDGCADTREVPVGDMASAPTAVTVLDADGDTVDTVDVTTELVALPLVRKAWEPITHLRLRPDAPALADGYQLQVTGSWGWPAIPDDVAHAAKVTVATWMRRGVMAFSTSYAPEDPGVVTPDSLPASVRAMLATHHRRVGVA